MELVDFSCNICGSTNIGRISVRGDGKRVRFCQDCDMGVIENPPESTDFFYESGYYGGEGDAAGYADYELTAEHSLLWVRMLIEALFPRRARILDVGCADGFLLEHLKGNYEKFGIEVNDTAIKTSIEKGIVIVGRDVLSSAISKETIGKFDAITSIATFEHLLDFKAAFVKCLDLLNKDGILIFDVPLISMNVDSSGWYNSSYEHIYYPTVSGIERLFSKFSDTYSLGFESHIRGFSPTYIGVMARNKELFDKVAALIEAMRQTDIAQLSPDERRLNVAYNLVHNFNPTPDGIKALADLIHTTGAGKTLIRHVCNLWLQDNLKAGAADWHHQQAANWKEAYDKTAEAAEWHRQQAANWKEAYDKTAEAAEWHRQQAANWKEAYINDRTR